MVRIQSETAKRTELDPVRQITAQTQTNYRASLHDYEAQIQILMSGCEPRQPISSRSEAFYASDGYLNLEYHRISMYIADAFSIFLP